MASVEVSKHPCLLGVLRARGQTDSALNHEAEGGTRTFTGPTRHQGLRLLPHPLFSQATSEALGPARMQQHVCDRSVSLVMYFCLTRSLGRPCDQGPRWFCLPRAGGKLAMCWRDGQVDE